MWPDESHFEVRASYIRMATSLTGMGAPPIGMAALPIRIVVLQTGIGSSPVAMAYGSVSHLTVFFVRG